MKTRRSEGDVSAGCELHTITRLRVPAQPPFALDHIESTKARQLHILATHQASLHDSENQLHHILSFPVGNPSVPLVNNFRQVGFYHNGCLLDWNFLGTRYELS